MFNRKSVKRAAAAALTAVMIFSQSSVVMADTASNHAADGTDAYAAAATTISGTAVKEDSTASDAAGAEKTAGAGTSTAEAGASENATTGAGMQATATGAGTSTDTATTAGAGTSTDTATTAGADTSMDTASTAGSLTHADNSTGAATTAAIEESAEAADTEDIAVPEGATDDKTGAALDGTLTFENDAIRVKADFTKDAEIPEGAELSVSMIGDDDEAYDSYKKIAEDKVSGVLDYLKLYDISIVKDGGEIEPKAPVTVSIEHTDGASLPEDETIEILHMTEDGSAETLEASASMSSAPVMRRAAARNAVSAPAVTAATATARSARKTYSGATFKTGSFSVFAEAGSLKTVVVTAEGENYTAAVTFGKDAGIPAGAVLTAKELTGDAGDEYRQKAAEALGEQEITQARFFDIHFTVDGKEQEPAPGASVQVRLAFSDSMEVGKSGEVKAVHFKEGADGVTPEILDTETSALASRPNNTAAATDSDAGAEMTAFDVVDFTQGSFSVMGVVVTGDKLQEGWPKQDSIYVTLLTKNRIHYAVKNDGTLLQVDINNDGKVIFNVDENQLVDYLWVTDMTNHLIFQNTGDSTVYLDPERGVVNVEPGFIDVNIVSGANGEYYLQSENQYYYYYGHRYRYNYFITVVGEEVSRTDNKDDAATISFADFCAKTSESGGTTPGENLEKPETKKTCVPNDDGTYNLSLSIKGKTDTSSESNKADVIVVLDLSGSMNYKVSESWWDTSTRLSEAKRAVNALASTLLGQNTAENPDLLTLSLVTFSNYATTRIAQSKNLTVFQKTVNNLSADGGTNWEDALKKADNLKTRDGADVYVIFVSDGDPTYRNTNEGSEQDREYASHTSNGHTYYGSGDTDKNGLNYKYALLQAISIVKNNKEFYTVGAFGDEEKMQQLTTEASAPANNYQKASNTAALDNAFKNIINKITHNLGYQSVSFHDGLTQMTSTSLRLVDAAADEFTYEVLDDEGNEVQVTSNSDNTYSYSNGEETKTFHGAIYDDQTRAVTWNMDVGSTSFELDNNYTYKVSFKVWPSQQAYDLLADLMNEKKSYDELLDVDKKQIIKNGDGTYSLQTNTDDTSVTYTPVTTTTDSSGSSTSQTLPSEKASIENPDGIPLTVEPIKVIKKWDDGGNAQSQRPEKISFDLVQDKDNEKHNNKFIENAELKGNDWSKTIYIAPGLIVKEDGNNKILNKGHTYDIVEKDIDSHYELSTETYHPMLVKTDKGVEIYNYVNGKLSDSPIKEFTAENKLKGSLSLEKKVFNADGKDITKVSTGTTETVNPAIADETFSYLVTLVAPRERIAGDFKYQLVKQGETGADLQTLKNDGGTISEYKLTPAVTSDPETTTVNFTVTLKPGEKLELPFLPLYTKYTITEVGKDGYKLKDITVTEGQKVIKQEMETATGTIDANQTDAVVFSNKFSSAFNLKLLKTNDSTESAQKLAGAEFTLQKVNADGTGTEAVNIEGTVIGTEEDPIKSGTEAVLIGDLPSGKYRLTETKAPDGYTKLENPIEFTIDRAKAGQKAVDIISADPNTVATVEQNSEKTTDYTITIQNKAIYVLPHSGGNGVAPYMVAGVVLMLVAAGVLGTGGVLREGGGSH